MFPLLLFDVVGLDRRKEYNLYVRAVPSDKFRYKYLRNCWTAVGDIDSDHDETKMIMKHPSSPQTGAKWMMKDVDFRQLKITHHRTSKSGHVSPLP